MKVGDKFTPNKLFFETFGCHRLKRLVEKGLVLEVLSKPSRTGKFKYGYQEGGFTYGFNDEHVIPTKPKQLENK